jgi:GDP-mannose 6-dehydrogenase
VGFGQVFREGFVVQVYGAVSIENTGGAPAQRTGIGKHKTMKIGVFGLGYVGCVSMGCLARDGHEMVGIDVSPSKVNLINQGRATIVESGIDELVRQGWENGRITATEDHIAALRDCDASIICVGTPNVSSGHLDLGLVYRVAENIGRGLRENPKFHVVLIRSTVLPGANQRVGALVAEHSGKERGRAFEVVSNPEFLREATAVMDFYNPPVTVAGTDSDRACEIVAAIYKGVNAPVRKTSIRAAEMIKLVNNSWHALKVAFGNEIGVVCKSLGIDSHEVMDLFCLDTKLNLSPYYLKPGFAYGGSCLPKDLKALTTISHDHYLDTPVIDAIEPSNAHHKRRLIDLVAEKGFRRVGILGFSFKPGTDDLRNSPIVEAAEILLGRGYQIRIYDKNVHLSNLMGTNREYINAKIPHLAEMISDNLEAVIEDSEFLIVANKEEEFLDLPARYPDKFIIDLVHIAGTGGPHPGGYDGISW